MRDRDLNMHVQIVRAMVHAAARRREQRHAQQRDIVIGAKSEYNAPRPVDVHTKPLGAPDKPCNSTEEARQRSSGTGA